ncbi:helix-turn-helix transcriptional regulator [Microbacterium petrolearium]|jgi:transcriptional regulator with XRE-family HTH domain
MTTAPRVSFGALVHLWRDRLSPADAGLTRSPGRRAPGLRREELAQLAGLSVDYLLRLEQGRATRPSAQVAASLARALQLSRAERDELFTAAGLLPPRDGVVNRHVPPGIQRLTSRLGDFPIAVFAADWSLVWWNAMWAALHGDPGGLTPRERNLARAAFGRAERLTLRPGAMGPEPGEFLAGIAGELRRAASRYPEDAELRELVAELHRDSADFARCWAAGGGALRMAERKTIRHPEAGDITLDCDVLHAPESDLRVVTYTAPEGSADAGQLDLLRVLGRGATAAP